MLQAETGGFAFVSVIIVKILYAFMGQVCYSETAICASRQWITVILEEV